MSVTIETDLRDILNKLDQRFDKIDQRFDKMEQRFERMEQGLNDLKVGQTINTKIDGLQKTVDKLSIDVSASKQDISDLKGVKSLIVPGFVALLASLLTFVFRGVNLQ
jgi:archaellum component FlaC